MSHWSDALPRTAGRDAVDWARTQPDYQTAWACCDRADWMLWLIGYYDQSKPMSDERRSIVRCALEVAAPARERMPSAAAECYDLVARWCDGADVTADDMLGAARAADAAADAAVWAADAAEAAAWAAWAAAWPAADAAVWAETLGAQLSALRAIADIVRRHYPAPPTLPAPRPTEEGR